MQGFSRVLTVLAAVLSIAFMGFAGVATLGGPNWESQAKQLDGFTFSKTTDEVPLWVATRSADREDLSTKSAVLPQVYAAALQDLAGRAKAEASELTTAIPELQRQTQTYRDFQGADVPALDRHFARMQQQLATLNGLIKTSGEQQDAIAAEILQLESQLDSRRQDVFQLDLQYRVLQGEIERIDQNIAVVEEQIRLVEDELDKSQRREKALAAQGL